ncbi:MAG: hypothetical protein ACYS4W_05180 [Planctomycetota bacterium]|jgi:hypothetical protein
MKNCKWLIVGLLVTVAAMPVNAADVQASKSVDPAAPNIYYPGDIIRYVISLGNGHPTEDIRIDLVEDVFPGAMGAVPLDSTFDISFPDPPYTLVPGASQVYEIDWQVPAGVTGVITNECRYTGVQFSTLPDPFDATITKTSLVIKPGTLVGISASPTAVPPGGTDVTLTVTEENTGTTALTSPSVDLAPLGLVLTDASPEFVGGDNGNGELDVAETWTWVVVDPGVDAAKNYTATGHGIDDIGNDVTWCEEPGSPPDNTFCDANERAETAVGLVDPNTQVGIWASPMHVSPGGTDITLLIGELNTGDVVLTSPSVEVAPLGLVLTDASPEFLGGDNGNGELDIGELWWWGVVDPGVNAAKTYTVIGHGLDPFGNDVTWCEEPGSPPDNTLCDQDERAETGVGLIDPNTLVDISASPMEVDIAGTDVTLTITEENTGDVPLTSPGIELAPLGLILTSASPEFVGGDNGNGILDVGETWTWIVIDVGVTDTKTYTATGHGIDPFGDDVTWCDNPGSPPANTLCDQDEQDEVTVEQISREFCGFTQGFWGNYGGKKFGIPTVDLINELLLDGPVVIGKNDNSVTLNDADCIIKRLPAGGRPRPRSAGNVVDNCTSGAGLPLKKKGDRYSNVLMGQIVALTLNTRLGGHGFGGDLGDFVLQEEFCVQDPWTSVYTIPTEVIDALANLGLDNNVYGLLELANRALDGDVDLGGASIPAINKAVTTINEAFDDCATVIDCP